MLNCSVIAATSALVSACGTSCATADAAIKNADAAVKEPMNPKAVRRIFKFSYGTAIRFFSCGFKAVVR
jgi:hypothetical protein